MLSPPNTTRLSPFLLVLCAGLAGCAASRPVPEPPTPPPPTPVQAEPATPPESPIYMQWEEAPKLENMVKPVYPAEHRQAGVEGRVVLQIVVDETGRVTEAEVILSTPTAAFGEAAVASILQWRFTPARVGGKPVKVRMGQTMDFTLADIPPGKPEAEAYMPPHSDWDQAPRLIHRVSPRYPEIARKAGVEGRVILQIVVDETGKVIEAVPVVAEPPGIFEEAAIAAIRQWRFEPALKDGKPIKVRMGQLVEFKLDPLTTMPLAPVGCRG